MTPVFMIGNAGGWALLLMAIGLGGFYIYCYRQEALHARRLKPGQKKILRLLRISVGLLAVLALAQPAMPWVYRQERLPVLPIVLDESTSMNFPDCRDNPLVRAAADDQRKRFNTARKVAAQLQEKLSLTHRVKLFAFSDTARLIKAVPHRQSRSDPVLSISQLFEKLPEPTGDYSNIGDALQNVMREQAGDKVSGIVLLSDGRQTGGQSLMAAGEQAADAHLPLHTVVLGSEFPLRDLAIKEVIVDSEASLGDVLRFTVKINNQIRAPLAAKLTLFEEGKRVNEKQLNLSRGDNSVAIATIPIKEGLREFKLSLPRFEDEVDTANNQAVVHVKIVKRTLRVLLMAGNPSREYFYLLPALLRDPVVRLSCWLQSADIDYIQQGNLGIDRLPRNIEEWKKYDVVLLFDVDPNKITSQQVAEIEHMVRDGGGLMVIAGRNHGLAKLIQVHAVKVRELLPVEIDKNRLPDYFKVFERSFGAARTPRGKGHPITRLDRDAATNDKIWKAFPDLYWCHPVKRAKPRSVVLLETSAAKLSSRQPVMAIHRYYKGSVFYSGINSLWRWRYPYGSYDYDRFWTNVIRYLGETRLRGKQQQVALSTDRALYSPGEDVKLVLRVLDPALMAQLQGQSLYASVTTPRKEVQMVALRPDRGGEMVYTGNYSARRTGSMLARVKQSAPGGDSKADALFDVEHTFKVKMMSLETRDTSADLEGMRELARQTGGKYYDYRNMSELEQLIKAIPTEPQVLSEEKLVDLWDGSAFLTLFLLLICCEWSLRKLWGLL
jgi:uncharacterized membrane protein